MWNVLTTASATPILEIDFLGADAWELLGFPDQAKFNGLQSGEFTSNMQTFPYMLCSWHTCRDISTCLTLSQQPH